MFTATTPITVHSQTSPSDARTHQKTVEKKRKIKTLGNYTAGTFSSSSSSPKPNQNKSLVPKRFFFALVQILLTLTYNCSVAFEFTQFIRLLFHFFSTRRIAISVKISLRIGRIFQNVTLKKGHN